MLRIVGFLVGLEIACHGSFAQAPKRAVTLDDYFTLSALGEVAISSDGRTVVYTEARWQEATNDRASDIWTVDTEQRQPRRLTFDRGGYKSIKIDPTGQWVYYLAKHKVGDSPLPYDGTRQVWRMSTEGGESIPMTRVDGGIELYDLAADGSCLYYITHTEVDEEEWSQLRQQFSELNYATLKAVQSFIWKVDLSSWRASQVAKFAGAVDDFEVSRDGKRIAMVTGKDGAVITMEGGSTISIVDLSSGKSWDLLDGEFRKTLASPYGRVQQPKWTADGTALAFMVAYDAYPARIFVVENKAEPGTKIRQLPTLGDMTPFGSVSGDRSIAWKGHTHDLAFRGDNHARVRIYVAENATADVPKVKELTPGDIQVDLMAWDSAGRRAAAIVSTMEEFPNICIVENGNITELADIHAHTVDWSLPKVTIVQWKGARGDVVEGVLELPPAYDSQKALPLIVNIHGGPTDAWRCGMAYTYFGSVYYASQGYALFSPNYRGSTGYGDKFLSELIGHQNEIDVEDILTGVDELVRRGVADRNRLAIAGWSNGGYLTLCALTKTDRFKAAACGAGIADQILEWGSNDEPAYQLALNRGAPWERKEAYIQASPVFDFGKIKTPTLFHVGELDERCPKEHVKMAHRALKSHNRIPSELIIYPGEEHGLNQYQHRKAKLAWESAWIESYLK